MKNLNYLQKFAIALAISPLLLSSCTKEDDKRPTMRVSIKMNTVSTPTKATPVNTLVFNSGSVTIREIVFDGDKGDEESISITHEQISTIDLVTGVANPPVDVIIPEGVYTDVNLGIEIQDETDKPSIIAVGVYTNAAGNKIPVRFEFNSGEVFEAEAEAITFGPGTSAIAEINFSPAVWFSTITRTMLDNAVRVNNVILVNESTNANIFTIVADKLDDATDATFR